MRRSYERYTKARLSLSGGPHTPANMADNLEEVIRPTNYGGFSERACLEASLFRQPYVIRQNSLPALARN